MMKKSEGTSGGLLKNGSSMVRWEIFPVLSAGMINYFANEK
jgi:hypothetical protein